MRVAGNGATHTESATRGRARTRALDRAERAALARIQPPSMEATLPGLAQLIESYTQFTGLEAAEQRAHVVQAGHGRRSVLAGPGRHNHFCRHVRSSA